MAPRSNPPVPPFRRKIIARFTVVMLLFCVFSVIAAPAGAQEPEQGPEADQPEGDEQTLPSEEEQIVDPAVAPDPGREAAEVAPEPEAIAGAAPAPDVEQPVDPASLDPMSQEAPGEEAPATDITVPPQDTYEGQETYEPPEILWSSVAAADRKLGDAQTAKRSAIAEARRLRKRLKELGTDQEELDSDTVETLRALAGATARLENRAVVGYQRFGSGSDPAPEITISDYQDVVKLQRRSKLVDSALVVGEADIELLAELRSSLNTEAVALLDRARVVSDHLADAEGVVADLDAEAEQASIEYEAFKAGSEIFIHGVMFPIAGSYGAPFDSYGFPRMPGTPDEHWHEGIDLFADRGTPLVATERGVITKLGSGRLGGLKFWLKGESGSEWYYAHLDSFAPGMADGLVVEAGQLVGYVGNTGNAISTPPHLHMQLHPNGGEPVNPYPLLKVVSDLDKAAIAAGTHPGYEHLTNLVAGPVQIAEPEEPVESTTTESETIEPETTEPSIDPVEPDPAQPAQTVDTTPPAPAEPVDTTPPTTGLPASIVVSDPAVDPGDGSQAEPVSDDSGIQPEPSAASG